MQFPQNPDHSQRPTVPPDSPWRNTQLSFDGSFRSHAQQGMATGGPGMGGQPVSIKLPNLPRLGSQNQMGQDQSKASRPPSRQQNPQPTFAQIVQQSQQNHPPSHGPVTPTGKVLSQRGVSKFGGSTNSPSASQVPTSNGNNNNGNGDYYSNNSAAQILGSVNSQMMPRVNTSHGMSSLNTVLPGMSNSPGGKLPSRTSSQGAEPVPRTPMLQNLNIDDKSHVGVQGANPSRQLDTEKYGLKPLLGIMDSKNKERETAILGDDLSQSGLNMEASSGKLSHTFASPWRENSMYPVIPDFRLPSCYSIDTVVPQQQKLQNFDEGALFYIFYTMPRDAMQEAAAVELTNRSWRYHKELKMWLTKDPMSEPIQTNSQEESGIYIFFDPATWKKVKREYILYYPDIA